LDHRNKWGYDILLFRVPASQGKKIKAVTLYGGTWHELEHDSTSRRPYLGIIWTDIHDFNRDSLPSKNKPVEKSSDEELAAPWSESEEASDEEPTQQFASPIEQTTTLPATPRTTNTYDGTEPPRLPPANTHHSSIATIHQEQQQTTTNMVTMTTTATAATTTVWPGTLPATTPMTMTIPSQRITDNLQTTMWRAPGGSGGPPSSGGPGGPGRPGPAVPAPAVPAGGNPPAANPDNRLMGSLPQLFNGEWKLGQTFLDQLTNYFRANSWVPGLNSPIRKVSIALTLFQGQQVAAWVRDMGGWIDTLDPVNNNIQEVWDTFIQEFNDHFSDSQLQQRARLELDKCKMHFPDVDQYISDFKDLVWQAGYTISNKETIRFFLNGLTPSILDKVIRAPFPTTYGKYKAKAVEITKGRQMIELIWARRGLPNLRSFNTTFGQNWNQF
jgi:Retrotransposon gag protein